jgi:methyl-accepting chemotaxis protein
MTAAIEKKTLFRQVDWLKAATNRSAEAAKDINNRCGSILESAGMAFFQINTNAEASAALAQSIEKVSEQLSRTAEAAVQCATSSEQTAAVIQQLEQATKQIGNVMDTIRRIAMTTNLLALNATIEAARAGEAGRGFAVVAHEVRALATQTAEATKSIDDMVKGIRSTVQTAVTSVQTIQHRTTEVQQMTAIGAEAVEQQRASVIEISQSAQDASAAVTRMQEGMEQVAANTFELMTASEDLLSGAEIMDAKMRHLTDAA